MPSAFLAPRTPRGWFASFYWRVALSYVLLVLGLLVVQGMMVGFVVARANAQVQGRVLPGAALGQSAAALGRRLEQAPAAPLDALLRASAGDAPSGLHAVMKDGRVAGLGAEPLSDDRRQQALVMLGVGGAPPGSPTTPLALVATPIVVRGETVGLLLLVPPLFPSPLREVARVMSLPGTLLLPAAAAVATIVIFGPARRRLAALEDAADRLGTGDLSARAPAWGQDEFARLAAAFNRMAGDIEERDRRLRAETLRRQQLLADASHELKTPLTIIRGAVETLQMPRPRVDAADRGRALAMIDGEARRMSRIVRDLLDLAQHEHGVTPLDLQVFAPARLFAHVTARHALTATRQQVCLVTTVDPEADQLVADPHLVEEAIDNLVVNALRHTPAGGRIALSAAADATAARLAVTDSGPGIPAEHATRIFERFYKVDAARHGGTGGSGLGLSIVKAIAERHGGSVHLESEPGATTFTLVLPMRSGSESVEPLSGEPGPGLRHDRVQPPSANL